MNNFEVDTKRLLIKFSKLNFKKQKKVVNTALKEGAKILVKLTRKELKSTKIKNINKKNKYNSSLNSGIKYKVKNQEAKVHIMGDFRLRFFEKGTKIRKAKRKYNRGKIKEYRFFQKAKSISEKQVFDKINTKLSEAIKKISNL